MQHYYSYPRVKEVLTNSCADGERVALLESYVVVVDLDHASYWTKKNTFKYYV